jgi:hypothetical protein
LLHLVGFNSFKCMKMNGLTNPKKNNKIVSDELVRTVKTIFRRKGTHSIQIKTLF